MLPAILALALSTPPATDLANLLTQLAAVPAGPLRTERASELLLGSPYVLHPLGEGRGPDPKPRFRLDGFDCQTFVETALALGEARTPAQVRAALDDLRYAGAPSFETRNHYMMSQWVPSNLAKGYLGAPAEADQRAEKDVSLETWQRRWPRNIELPVDRVPVGHFQLALTTLDTLERTAATIPSGTLMLIVREDRPSFPDRVTHLGFVVQRAGHPFFRHASDVFKRVVDEPIDHFIARNRRYGYRVSGVALLPVRDNQTRVETLPTP